MSEFLAETHTADMNPAALLAGCTIVVANLALPGRRRRPIHR